MTRRRVAAALLCAVEVLMLSACTRGGGEPTVSPEEAEQLVMAQMQELSSGIEKATETFLEGLDRLGKAHECPRIEHITSVATEGTQRLAAAVDEVTDAAIVALLRIPPPAGGLRLGPIDTMTDLVRDETLALQADLLESALEENCEGRQRLLKEAAERFRTHRGRLLFEFAAAVGIPPPAPPSTVTIAPPSTTTTVPGITPTRPPVIPTEPPEPQPAPQPPIPVPVPAG